MLDIAATSVTVKSQTGNGLCCHNPSELKVRLGQEAMARQRRRWEDWMIIAEAQAPPDLQPLPVADGSRRDP